MVFRKTGKYWQLALTACGLTLLPTFAGEQAKECVADAPSPSSECVLAQMSHMPLFPPPPGSFLLPPPPFAMDKRDIFAVEGLSEAQKEQLIALQDSFEVSMALVRAELKQNLHKMFELLSAAEIDKGQIEKVKDHVDVLKKGLSDRHLEMSIKRAAIFSVEQREQLRQKMLTRFLREAGGPPPMGFAGYL